jgi:hypothetical protein
MNTPEELKAIVRGEYGQAARQAKQGGSSCCSTVCTITIDPITGDLYHPSQTANLPQAAIAASLGCGNPTALADIHPGETVLDLGSGGA